MWIDNRRPAVCRCTCPVFVIWSSLFWFLACILSFLILSVFFKLVYSRGEVKPCSINPVQLTTHVTACICHTEIKGYWLTVTSSVAKLVESVSVMLIQSLFSINDLQHAWCVMLSCIWHKKAKPITKKFMQLQKSPSYIAQFYTQCVQCICCHNVSVRLSRSSIVSKSNRYRRSYFTV